MYDVNRVIAENFLAHVTREFCASCPDSDESYAHAIERASRLALELLLNCDCQYHDLHHTILVTDAGMALLRGRAILRTDVDRDDWLNAVVAMLFHDIGYVRGVLSGDTDAEYVTDQAGALQRLDPGATGAALTPYHVNRGTVFVREHFEDDAVIDAGVVCRHIEMTRFPVPREHSYQETESMSALVRTADLIGQMADPLYMRKLPRLFAEFIETGEAERLGYANPGELRAAFPAFFRDHVARYVEPNLRYLRMTQEGQQWIASLHHHLYAEAAGHPNRDSASRPAEPLLATSQAASTVPARLIP